MSAIGFGCMNLSHGYGIPPPAEQGIALIRRAFDLGVTHFDTAALYSFGRNEEVVGRAIAPFRRRIHLASKCGIFAVDGKRVIDGRPETLKRTCHESLARLQTDVIDLYYLHRWDKSVPIEDSVGALSDLVAAGQIRSIGLSEVSAATLRRAHAVHPVAAVQSEYSVWTRNPEIAVIEECRRLGAAFIAFSPLARGLFAGSPIDPAQFVDKDFRRDMPRFQEPHFSANKALAASFGALARDAGFTSAQLALAWVLARAPHVVPIPGTTSMSHLESNLAAAELRLTDNLLPRIEALVNGRTVSGARYSPKTQAEIDTEEF